MAVYTSTTAVPREELGLAILEGASLNKDLIWDKVLPPLPVNQRTAHLPKLSIANAELMRIIESLSAPGSDIPRLSATVEDATINPAIRKQEIGIPVEAEMDYAKLFSLERFYSVQLGQKALSLTLEYFTAAQIFSTGNFGGATNSAVPYTNANLSTISFINDVYLAIERVRNKGEQPNTVIIPSPVYQRVRQSSLVKEFVRGALGAGAEVTANTIQQALADEGIEQVLVGRAAYNSAKKGSKTLTRVWENTYIWVGRAGYKNETSDEGVPIIDGVGGTVYWQPYGLMAAETYRDEPKEQQVVRGKTSGNPTILNANAGDLIATQYS